MAEKPFIVGVGGTTRIGSSSEQALTMALAHARDLGAETKLYGGADLDLPMYDPDPARMTDAARHLIDDLRRADGVIFSSPCYHGGVSGLLKNAIDYTEEMRSDDRVYLDGRAIGAIGCGYGNQGPNTVLAQLRQIGHALRGWNVPLGVAINSTEVKFEGGACSTEGIASQIQTMASQVVEFATKFAAAHGY
ncbi:MAG: NAD(P)H-dependent oxidoreductase [Acidimicrobiia bacterium]|nr:NAD(P)H-dependent oxidoreductase [Acidimicrobiia bacterium]